MVATLLGWFVGGMVYGLVSAIYSGTVKRVVFQGGKVIERH